MSINDIFCYVDLRARFNSEITQEEQTELLLALIKVHSSSDEIFSLLETFSKMEKDAKRITKNYIVAKEVLSNIAHEKRIQELFK